MNKQQQLEQEAHLVSLGRGKPVTIVDFDAIQKTANERNKKWSENHPPRVDGQKEYDTLIQKHFDLKQQTHSYEQLVNEAAAKIHNCEERIKQTKQLHDGCESPLGKANYKEALHRLEAIELIDCKNALHRLRRYNQTAVAALRDFEAEFLPRIEKLRKLVTK